MAMRGCATDLQTRPNFKFQISESNALEKQDATCIAKIVAEWEESSRWAAQGVSRARPSRQRSIHQKVFCL